MSLDMNSMMRRAGNRSRTLPDIGQTPAVQAASAVMGQPPMPAPAVPAYPQQQPAPSVPQQGLSPMAAPPVQQSTFTLHPPGEPADPNQYNYEPQADGSWRVYPPGVAAPQHTASASLPRAASTADYRRLNAAFQQGAPR